MDNHRNQSINVADEFLSTLFDYFLGIYVAAQAAIKG